ncbi:MAG: glycosyltransferase [Verrucomicrobiota bacterium]|jgi:glycosyltransferase involved in cell wall biosynthesis
MRVPDPSLLILIPAYNEEARIEPVLRDYADFFGRNYSGKFQIIVVLNGCRDNTLGVVQRVAKDFPSVGWLDFPAPIGKGGALIEGLKLAGHADYIGYVDADGATGPPAFFKLIPYLAEADCVIGSRWLPDSVLLQKQPTFRRFISRCFHFIVEILFWLHIKDTQCPCKLMRREAVEKIHSYLRIADLAFDVNLLVALHQAGFKVREVPIEWTDMIGSKVTASLFRSSLAMFLSVVRVWLIYRPFIYKLLRPLRPLETWLYRRLRAPRPLSSSKPPKQP